MLGSGPVAAIFIEDEVEIESTLRHHAARGFRTVLAFAPADIALSDALPETVQPVAYDTRAPGMLTEAMNALIAAAPGVWFYYGYNAEYLYYPFCESRSIGEMLTFHGEERRAAMLAYVVDLYADDLEAHPGAVSRQDAFLDSAGYYALARRDGEDDHPKERQLDFFGGLRWRFEEHVPEDRRRIDRIALFRARAGLRLLPDHRLNDEEMNTYACPWHHNLTAAVVSFRTAKALKRNPGSSFDIPSFMWRNSVRFEWSSGQLLDLGLMEPGQWF
ncbi:hypothetical protein [Poseidonocella sedimentorum]|nr:hypothetical protein [Poseidonocella sedimentorum]